jgi:methylenetetrahydrofolate dehydrogenase (NADP+) / methenyltetrahydrofolate cyclohydrolase
VVGEEGFEPPTSCSQSRRATRLRYTPNVQLERGGIILAPPGSVNAKYPGLSPERILHTIARTCENPAAQAPEHWQPATSAYSRTQTCPEIDTPMSALVLDGKALAQKFEAEMRERVVRLRERAQGSTPILATILVGADPASATYVKMKGNACERVGMESLKVELPDSTTTDELLAQIQALNDNPDVHGILLQHPVPAQIDERACFDAIALEKDVDGVTCLGFGRMSMGEHAYGCATPRGIMRLLEHYGIALAGQHAVVVGRSPILGKPMAMMLLGANATVTICHSRTQDLEGHIRRADLVVGAVGRPEFIKADWIKDGAVVVDAGYHPGGVGDIELGPLKERVSAWTPVPGGVGPMTINTLIFQTLEAGEKALG